MDRLLVKVTCAQLGESYDAFVPCGVSVGEAAVLLGRNMEEVTNRRYIASGSELLCVKENGRLLNRTACIGACGIANGDSLILF